MRRLWAYIITAVTTLLVVGVSFSSIFLKMSSNNEYESGKELVFRVSDKDDENIDYNEEKDDTAINNIVSVMEERLKNSGIRSYYITTSGYDTIKVSFSDASSNDHYSLISNYLTFNGALALTDSSDKVVLMDQFRSEKKAYVTEENSLPKIVVPVNQDNPEFQAVVESAHKEHESKESEGSSESEEENTTTYIYLWYDFDEKTDSYTAAQEDETMAKKILIPFDITQYSKDEDTGKYPDELVTSVNIDTNEDKSASVEEVREGFYRAKYYVNLLNAGELDYKVTFLYSSNVDATIEPFINLGSFQENVALTATLRAFIISILLVSCVLVFLYRLSSLSGITLTLTSVFATLGFMVLFGVEINTASIVGLIISSIVSLACFIVYQNKFKNEAYRGRSLKKANSEAMKKSLLPIVDINVVSIIIGAFIYLIGGIAMRGLSAALVLGGVISLLLNTLGLRGMMWMVTNTTALTGKYQHFGIDETKVPNLSNEEKQTYYGSFANSQFVSKKNTKIVGIIATVLTVATIVGVSVFGAVNKGQIFNAKASQSVATEIYFEAVDRKDAFSENTIQKLLDNMLIYEEGKETSALKSVGSHIIKDGFLVPETLSEKVKVDDVTVEHIHYFYIVTLDTNAINNETLVLLNTSEYPSASTTPQSVNAALEYYISEYGNASLDSALLKENTKLTPDAIGWGDITLATFIGIVILSVYFALRYRPSRAIAALLGMSVTSAITLGIFVLTRFPITSYVLAMLPGVAIIAAILMVVIMNKERDMILEDRSKENDFAHKEEMMLNANSMSFDANAVIVAVSALIAIMFFGFSASATSSFYTFLFIGIAIALCLIITLFVPVALFFIKLLSRVNINIKPRKSKKKKSKPKASKSAEPEEAIFIGIND